MVASGPPLAKFPPWLKPLVTTLLITAPHGWMLEGIFGDAKQRVTGSFLSVNSF